MKTKPVIHYFLVFFLLLFSVKSIAADLPIQIRGISGNILKNVETRLHAMQESYGKTITEKEKSAFLLNAPQHIRKALEPFGYFKSKISSKRQDSTYIFTIDLGPPLRISTVDIRLVGEGKNNLALREYIKNFPVKKDQIFSAETYNKAKDDLFEISNNEGYLKASLLNKEIRIHLKNNTASIFLVLDTGPRYYFGHILYGPNPFAPEFLHRFDSFHTNEPFSSQKLQKYQQNLRDSNYFREADVTPLIDETKDHTVPVNVNLTPQKSQRYDIGIGYGTYTGPRFMIGTDFRRVTKTGHHFSTKVNLSSVLKSFTANYYIPGKNPLTDQYTIGGNIQYFSPKNGSSFSQSLTFGYDKKNEIWQNSISLNFLNERYKVLEQPTHQSQILYPRLLLTRVYADNIMDAHFGNMLSFSIQGASDDIFSRTSFVQGEVKGKLLVSPTKYSKLLFRGDLGYTVVEDLNQLPLSLRYFAGGINSVRGYPYNTIGPGKYLEVASAELQHQIWHEWSGAVFYDVGNASNTFNGQFNRGAGVGIIYHSLIGSIQLYAGRALSKPDKPWTLEFNIGPDF